MTRLTIPVVFRPEMSVPNLSYSPSADKPRQVVADWLSKGLPIHIVRPEPTDARILKRVHDSAYVDAIFAGRAANGFANTDQGVNESTLHTVGAMILAAQIALAEGVACAPVSGFHHAGRDFGGGYCTFNGLMVAIEEARWSFPSETISAGIIDLDYHPGNGTEDIITRGGNESWLNIKHFSSGLRDYEPRELLGALPGIVRDMAESCDLVLYQAGADMHIHDPLGGLLTTHEMRLRDRIVFETFAKYQRPGSGLAWCLAGGYQRDLDETIQPVLNIHRATMEECAKVFVGKEIVR